MAVKLKIKSEADDKGIKKAKRDVTGLQRHVGVAAKRIAGFLAAAFAVRKMTQFGRSVLQAFGIQQKAVEKLRAVLVNAGEDAGSLIPQYERLASSLQSISDHGDEAILSVMALGRSMGLTGANLENATKAAVGLAQGFDMSLESAMRNIAKLQGNLAGELGELIPELKNAKTAQEKMNIVFAIGNQRLKESERLSDTYARKVSQMSMKWGDFKEKLGAALVNFIESRNILDKIISLLDKMNAIDLSAFANQIKEKVLSPLRAAAGGAARLFAFLTNDPEAAKSLLDWSKGGGGDAGGGRGADVEVAKQAADAATLYRGKPWWQRGPTRQQQAWVRAGILKPGFWRKGMGGRISADELEAMLKSGEGQAFTFGKGRENIRAMRERFSGINNKGSSFAKLSKSLTDLRRGASSVEFRSLSGGDLFDALAGDRAARQQLGEKGNPMFVNVVNNPKIGVNR